MKLKRSSPLLLILVPSLLSTSVFADSNTGIDRRDAAIDSKAAGVPTSDSASSPIKAADIGTKDAPVDGKDGKPHAGPFVEIDKKKSAKPDSEDELITEKRPPLKDKPKDPTIVDGKKIPEKNDGVMNEDNRPAPKEGTTGTEGGVTEKSKALKAQENQTGEKAEKTPTSPKEPPKLPPDEQGKVKSLKDGKETTLGKDFDEVKGDASEFSGLEKPDDLPESPHSQAQPVPISADKDHLDVTKPVTTGAGQSTLEEEEGLIQPFHSFVLSLTMILFSEIGDKTFLVAALMAMKHDRFLVFSAALSALIAMTVLSAVLGHAVPTLLPKRATAFAAAVLFLVFGAKLMREGLAMSADEGVGAEMQEVEMELAEKEQEARNFSRRRSSISPYALEMGMGSRHTRKSRSGSRLPSPPRSPSMSPERSHSPQRTSLKGAVSGLSNLLSLLLSPAWVQTFVMTFLGEWGDRSQIATIAMAAGQDYWWVTGGAIAGHSVCTGVAVIGGRAIAGRVSMRVVTLGGAGAFLIFGLIYAVEAVFYA